MMSATLSWHRTLLSDTCLEEFSQNKLMGRGISLFSGYDQRENRTTNYCLLMLRQLYSESPKYLAEVLRGIAGDEAADRVGVQFRQQEKTGQSIPDGRITQPGFQIFIETKHHDWFYWEQIREHLVSLQAVEEQNKIFIALANFQEIDTAKFEDFEVRIRNEFGDSILFLPVSFEELIESIESIDLPIGLQETAREFRIYLESSKLLDNWQERLIVVNCGATMHEIEGGAYLCPTTSASYSLTRSKFFAPYRWKRCDSVNEAIALVDVHNDPQLNKVHWNNSALSAAEVTSRAEDIVKRFRPTDLTNGVRVLLLGEPHPTQLIKDTKGGLFGTKRYFRVQAETAEELGKQLENARWSELPRM